jgi:EAL domain-containing protein (putative c-di-GMP-specific phosphodiesterase class I)/GGDEF domain-containing protein
MPDHPLTARESLPSAAEPVVRDPAIERRFTVFSLILLGAGVVAAALLSWWLPLDPEPRLIWVGIALVLGFFLVEQFSVNIDVRTGVSWSISFTEIPLVAGLFIAPFHVVLAAHLIAGIGVLLIRGVQDKVLYNTGAESFEIIAAFTVFTLAGSAFAGSTPEWLAAFVGAVSAPVTSTLLALVGMWVLGRRLRGSSATKLVSRTLVLGLVNASFGVVAYEVITKVDFGWPLMLALLGGICALYFAYAGLVREQRDLEALSDVSLIVARSGRRAVAQPNTGRATTPFGTEDWPVIARRIKEQLGAARVVLRLRLDPQEPMTTIVAGDELAAEVHQLDATGSRADALLRLPGSHVRHFRRADALPEIREALDRREAQEALVVPLRSASHLLGVIEAHDKLSRWRGFGEADTRMIGTTASHLATALDNRRLVATLRHDAYHDPLTGEHNLPGFRQVATGLLDGDQGSVMLRVDLEVQPAISDALGYTWIDRIVISAGRRLREVLGKDVPLARLEGANFAALLVDTDVERAQQVVDEVVASLATPYPIDRLTIDAGVVVGYASSTTVEGVLFTDAADTGGLDVDELLKRADVALRAARTGGERARAYLPSMGQTFLRRFQLVTQFRQSLEAGHVKVHYQPKVALPSREVLGVEALVRWRHPEFGPLFPDEFVPAVEAAGLVDVLTDFVLDAALTRVRKWLDEDLRISAAVNLSVRSLADEHFPDRVAAALTRHGVPPGMLTLELTESGVMADPQRALPVLRALDNLGVVLAVDDFGTGYSSLAYLRQLPVHEVKIDKSFVLGMGSDLGDLAVVRSIVELGHSLGLTVVAEGVEEDAARDQLTTMGCDVAQGYLISRPLSESRLAAWLQARTAQSRGRRDETVLTLLS